MPNTHKIAVLRPNVLGDFVFALPALHALRTAYPHAEIVYLGKDWHADFVPGRVRDIDRVIVIPPTRGVGESEGFETDENTLKMFFAAMQRERFDVALQMYGGGRFSNPFLRQLGARHTVGMCTPDADRLDISIPYVFYQNEIFRQLEIVSYIGATTAKIVPTLDVTPDDVQAAAHVVHSHATTPYAVIHPGASDPRRRWPPERFGIVANALLSQGYGVFVTGIESEQDEVAKVVAATRQRAVNLCGKISLPVLVGLLHAASIIVSNDTGPLHVAGAVRTPTVGIYWVGNLITAAPIRTAMHRPLLSWTVDCPLCGASSVPNGYPFGPAGCSHKVSFVKGVKTVQVLEAVQELLTAYAKTNGERGAYA